MRKLSEGRSPLWNRGFARWRQSRGLLRARVSDALAALHLLNRAPLAPDVAGTLRASQAGLKPGSKPAFAPIGMRRHSWGRGFAMFKDLTFVNMTRSLRWRGLVFLTSVLEPVIALFPSVDRHALRRLARLKRRDEPQWFAPTA